MQLRMPKILTSTSTSTSASTTTTAPTSTKITRLAALSTSNQLSQQQQQLQQQQQQQQQKLLNQNQQQTYSNSSNISNCSSSCSRLRLCAASVAILICLLACGITKTNAVPTDSSGDVGSIGNVAGTLLHRALRDILGTTMTANLQKKEQSTATQQQQTKEAATSTELQQQQQQQQQPVELQPQPKGQCLLDGLWVPENTVYCEKQTGCRAIQKTGHCCPDYKCDCEKDGKIYANRDKLVDPDTPCTVCYCKGGDILCSSVTCFKRDDCKPKYIPGRCCPEYDNCPIVTKTTSTTAKPDLAPPQPAFNCNITIKEITKPTEIRITDDTKPKQPMLPIRKTSTTEAPATTHTATTATEDESAVTPMPTPTTTTTEIADTSAAGVLVTESSSNVVESYVAPAEFSADNNHSGVNNGEKAAVSNSGIGESLKLSASVAYATSVKPFMGASGEIGEAHTTVLEAKPIGAFGLENLQDMQDPNKVNIKREYMVTTEGIASSTAGRKEPSRLVSESAGVFVPNGYSDSLLDSSVEAEPDTAGSDNIYHIIATTAGPSTTEGSEQLQPQNKQELKVKVSKDDTAATPLGIDITTDSPASNANKATTASTEVSYAAEAELAITESISAYMTESSSESAMSTSSTTTATSTTEHMDEELDVAPIESNPAYPSLPEDDFSLRDVNFPLVEVDDLAEAEIKDEPRSIAAFDVHDTQHATQLHGMDGSGAGSGSGSGAGILLDMDASVVRPGPMEGMQTAASSTLLGKHVPLMWSSEENSGETTVQNGSGSGDFRLFQNLTQPQTTPDASGDVSLESSSLEVMLEDGGSGSGSGNGEIQQSAAMKMQKIEREPTTPRPTPRAAQTVDIDELTQSGDGQSPLAKDPKLDAESLKLNESQERSDAVANVPSGVAAADKANIRAEKSAEAPEVIGQRIQRLYLQRIF